MDCLYRCESGAPSTQRYHLYPRSASVGDLLLPEGIVCDACNNYFSSLENHFTQYHPGTVQRMFGVNTTRKGKPPQLFHQTWTITKKNGDGESTVSIPVAELRHEFQENGDIHFVGTFNRKPFDATIVSRVLHKIALETLTGYADDEPEFSPWNPRFDPMGEYIRRPKVGEFRPFIWKTGQMPQHLPRVFPVPPTGQGPLLAHLCEMTFPGIAYVVAYPPWPTPAQVWQASCDNVVLNGGMVQPGPDEIRVTAIKIADGARHPVDPSQNLLVPDNPREQDRREAVRGWR